MTSTFKLLITYVFSRQSLLFLKLFMKLIFLVTRSENFFQDCFVTLGRSYPDFQCTDDGLQVSSPMGWNFEPSEVAVSVDGTSDLCSLGVDINFVLQGFAVTGQVMFSLNRSKYNKSL